ncbi:hypothetical protein DQ04_03251050 [Trypanosoma grayi]|uniref:hypothetical protein n=1 Tax=Trypanosoma grayi TaxID=71804 RepID=UPI0004F466CB|nr:hypothetical protein DQ04_03251050 [Trypanosoma grayi]KEG10827.1 hypothetical protein DQ04_03251050 [Trypanosoma grayi]
MIGVGRRSTETPKTLRELSETVGVAVAREAAHDRHQDSNAPSELQLRHILFILAFFAFVWSIKILLLRKPSK